MEKIASFRVNHLSLLPGLYVSRVDRIGVGAVTTFDLRMTAPNREPVLSTGAIHAVEHLGATYLRNHPDWKSRVIYFGPMGCRTGFYLLLAGELAPSDVLELVRGMLRFVEEFEGSIPGASARDCGNFLDMDLDAAREIAKRYRAELRSERVVYPL
ncbi:MAG: S-ribosylhomocysteine lyase [Clostridiales bacterium]|nr:S-ribosylhomocysteine lyase [Clostridiales bacterium]